MARKLESVTYYGHIKEGVHTFDNERWYRGTIQQYDDTPTIITIERKKKSKSQEQLGYLWGVIYPLISQHTGHSIEDLHDVFKTKYLKRKILWRGADMVTTGSTVGLSSNEMSEFISNVKLEANELGIEVPEPDKLYQFH